ncbi:alpha/beta fold hydrolase [Actinospica robiniae]|uniref:alpha/beta fold hydrolase n=1 Tax=Actinospica robiniae TaxID=304901 RepID=UPI0004216821|nr:alpha/beta hydrolase [Actinospica robiniae]
MHLPEVPGVTHRFVDLPTRGVRLHVAEAGADEGETVLLLHDFPQHWYAWRHVIPLLSADHRILAVDLRGFGWSDAPRGGYTGIAIADDLVALLDALGLKRVHLIGHGWGGWIGFILSVRRPERVQRFVAVNMTHLWPNHRKMLPNAWRMWHTALFEYPPFGRLLLRRGRWFIRFLLRHWSRDGSVLDRATLDVYADVFRDPAHARAGEQLHFQYVIREIFGHPRGRFRTAHLAVPTLIIGGRDDVVFPPSVLADGEGHADDLHVAIVEDAGHLLPEERPEAVAEHARAFFALRSACSGSRP